MQEAAKLLAALGDCIQAIEVHLGTVERSTLDSLLEVLPAKSPAGSAPMVMMILVYSEIEARQSPQ